MANSNLEQSIMNHSTIENIVLLAEGNPGAGVALAECYAAYPSIDPEALFGGLHVFFFFADMEISGPNIWILFKDVCGQDPVKVAVMMRAWQLGHLSMQEIKNWASDESRVTPVIDWEALEEKICNEVPNFNSTP